MDVPRDVRHLAGKTSWQHSLGTTDPTLADARRALYSSRYKAEVIRLRALLERETATRAEAVVSKAFDDLAERSGSIDRVVATELESLALTVRSSSGLEEAAEVEHLHLGQTVTSEAVPGDVPLQVFDNARARELFKLRARLFETHEETGGLVYQELARSLLERGLHGSIDYQVACIAHDSDTVDITRPDDHAAVGKAYLTRLAGHRFTSWPADLGDALAPIVAAQSAAQASPVPAEPSPIRAAQVVPRAASGRTLAAAFDLWRQRKGLAVGVAHKTADEFATAIRRFELLTGTSEVAEITPDLVKAFRTQVSQLPYRPKKELGCLPLGEQIRIAHEGALPTLSPPTVGKQIAGIRAMLAEAVEARWIGSNPAAGITVEGARWEGTERDHFSDDDMRLIYTSSLMTDPDACSDTMFWILFLAPFHGSRPGEHCKLKPGEIVRDGGEWLMRIRADRRRRRVEAEAPITRPRRQKTTSSIRDVPIHWIVAEGGFIDFAGVQRARGAEWLFDDLLADKYGDRYKYLSREINAGLRTLGITDPDKAFYSSRHTMKREGRRQRIAEQNLDQLAGHAASSVGSRYGRGVPADVLKSDIDRLEFRSVPWDAVVQCAKVRVARLLARGGYDVPPETARAGGDRMSVSRACAIVFA